MSILTFPIAIHQAHRAPMLGNRWLAHDSGNARRWGIGLILPRNTFSSPLPAIGAARTTTERIKASL